MPTLASTVDLLHLFGDPSRVRLTALLARHELTVAELTAITDLAQSRVSTHLGRLREAGVLRDRRDGASTFYTLNEAAMPDEARKVWALVRGEVQDTVLESDASRADDVLRTRRGDASWPERVAGEMERHYSPGRTWESMARGLIGLLRLGDVLDAGSGDGTLAEMIAPRARSVTCIDASPRMVEAVRKRLARFENARADHADVRELPHPDASFDQVLLFNVLCHLESPAKALGEAARVLRPDGDLVIVTLDAHRRLDDVTPYGHVSAGHVPAQLRRALGKAGLTVEQCAVTSRERRAPYFDVVTAFARKPSRRSS